LGKLLVSNCDEVQSLSRRGMKMNSKRKKAGKVVVVKGQLFKRGGGKLYDRIA